jgi:hypothetical protein
MMKRTAFPMLAVFLGILLIALFVGTVQVQSSSQSSARAQTPEQDGLPPGSEDILEVAEVNPPASLFNLRVPGIALQPGKSSWSYFSSGGCLTSSGDPNGHSSYIAPVYPPEGATVKYLRWYYSDYYITDAIGKFVIFDFNGDEVFSLDVPSTGSSGINMSTSEEITKTIKYDLYSYIVEVELPVSPIGQGAWGVCGFRIYYQPPPGALYIPFVARPESP